MAEVLAITAASVQLLDVGVRTYLAISQLCSNVKNAPRMLQTTGQQLRQLMVLVPTIQSDILALQREPLSNHDGVITQSDLVTLVNLVKACEKQARQLEDLLKISNIKADDPLLKKTWRAMVTSKNESEIMQCCRWLEESKSTIQLWYDSRQLRLQQKQL